VHGPPVEAPRPIPCSGLAQGVCHEGDADDHEDRDDQREAAPESVGPGRGSRRDGRRRGGRRRRLGLAVGVGWRSASGWRSDSASDLRSAPRSAAAAVGLGARSGPRSALLSRSAPARPWARASGTPSGLSGPRSEPVGAGVRSASVGDAKDDGATGRCKPDGSGGTLGRPDGSGGRLGRPPSQAATRRAIATATNAPAIDRVTGRCMMRCYPSRRDDTRDGTSAG
jgi:hypothetical protein